MTTITNANRKLAKKVLKERIDQLQSTKQNIIANLTALVKADYTANNQETVYNMDADQYEANLNTQKDSLTDRIQKLKDFVDWADEQVLA